MPGLLEAGPTAALWDQDLLKEALLVTFQSLLLENNPTILESFKVLLPTSSSNCVRMSQPIQHHLERCN